MIGACSYVVATHRPVPRARGRWTCLGREVSGLRPLLPDLLEVVSCFGKGLSTPLVQFAMGRADSMCSVGSLPASLPIPIASYGHTLKRA